MTVREPIVVVHGGAGTLAEDLFDGAIAGVSAAADVGRQVLLAGGTAEAAAVAAVRVLEDDPTFNAGRGACMTNDGTFEMDAAIMRSVDMRSGAVAAVHEVRDTILLAQLVMNETRHCLLAGEGAERFARARGVGAFGREQVWTAKAQARYEAALAGTVQPGERADTVGAVVLDAAGNSCSACSTGGVLLKMPGRVGDSPIVGAGLYAHPQLGAACATGVGEAILTHVACYEVLRRVSEGTPPDEAAREVCGAISTRWDVPVGMILLVPDGRHGVAHASQHMSHAVARGDQPVVARLGNGNT